MTNVIVEQALAFPMSANNKGKLNFQSTSLKIYFKSMNAQEMLKVFFFYKKIDRPVHVLICTSIK